MRIGKQSALKWAFDDFEFEEENPNYIDMKGTHHRLMKIQHSQAEKVVRKFKKNAEYKDAQEFERVARRGANKRKKTSRTIPLPDENIRGAIPSPDVTGSAISVPPLRPPQDVHSNVPPLHPHITFDGDGSKTSRI